MKSVKLALLVGFFILGIFVISLVLPGVSAQSWQDNESTTEVLIKQVRPDPPPKEILKPGGSNTSGASITSTTTATITIELYKVYIVNDKDLLGCGEWKFDTYISGVGFVDETEEYSICDEEYEYVSSTYTTTTSSTVWFKFWAGEYDLLGLDYQNESAWKSVSPSDTDGIDDGWSFDNNVHFYWAVTVEPIVTPTTTTTTTTTTTSTTTTTTLMPDLVITGIKPSNSNPYVGDTISVDVTVKNKGPGDASSKFWIDLFHNEPTPPSVGDYGDNYTKVSSLSAYSQTTRTLTGISSNIAETWDMYAIVDTDEFIDESNENNNVYGPVYVTWEPSSTTTTTSSTTTSTTTTTTTLPIKLPDLAITSDDITFEKVGG